MLPYTDHETLRLLVEQRREDLQRTMRGSRWLAGRLAGVVRRPAAAGKVLRMGPSKRAV
jgi:hypothetical protein